MTSFWKKEGEKCMNVIGKKFDEIVYNEVLNDISKAANSLSEELKSCKYSEGQKIFEKKMFEMKKIVDCYIEEQSTVFKKIKEGKGF